MKRLLYITLIIGLLPSLVYAQQNEKPVVQFSGFVMSTDSMIGIPFAHLGLKSTTRSGSGTARADGFFSYAVNEGDTIVFTCIGYSPRTYVVPTGVDNSKLSTIIQMSRTSYRFEDIPIYPWGSRDKFPYAFVHTRPDKQLDEIAEQNTNSSLLSALGEKLPIDGGEATMRYMQVKAVQASYYHQQAPQNIFNPFAWAEFVRALKRGDFKKKPDPQLPTNDY